LDLEEEKIEIKKPVWPKILIWAAIVLIAIFATMLILKQFGPKGQSSDNSKEQQGIGGLSNRFENNCQSNPNPVFTANYVELSKIKHLAPIGAINAGSPGRAYLFAKDDIKDMAALYAPTDATLEGIVFARRDPNNPNAKGEYRLDFRVSCEVTFSFDHLDDVIAEIKALAPTEPANNTREAKSVSFPVKAGTLVAYSDGTDLSKGFDFYLINKSKEVSHINQKRWEWDQAKYADCPYDYFVDDLKTQYYGMLKSQDGQKLSTQSCGSPSHDVAGTASGGWFQGDSTTFGKWLEIGNQNEKVEINFRNIGDAYMIRDYKPKVLPENLTVGNSTCYSDNGKWVYVKLDSETQLSVVKGTGVCPSVFPANNIEEWER